MKRVAIATVILGAAALAHAQPPRENPSTSGSQTLRISGRVLAEERLDNSPLTVNYLESLIPRASTIAFGDGQKQILNLKLAASAGR